MKFIYFSLRMILFLMIVLTSNSAMADGLDLAYFTWVDPPHGTITEVVGFMILLMFINYILNFAVIGVPAVKFGPTPVRSVSIGMIWLTMIGQIADRLGAILADVVGFPWHSIYASFAGHFLSCGITVGALALYFLRRRWLVPVKPAWIIAGIAAVITNPSWIIFWRDIQRSFPGCAPFADPYYNDPINFPWWCHSLFYHIYDMLL